MKISGRKNVNHTGAAGQNRQPRKAGDPLEQLAGAGQHDSIEFSSASRQLLQAKDTVNGLPDVRIERVSEIKLQVDDGQYHVESGKIAKKMVNESLRESAARKG